MSAVLPIQEVAPTIKLRIACAATVFIVSLAIYSWTLSPTVTLVDSGELIVAAHSLGVAHPPGFPLYVVLAHLASLVPLGNLAVRVNFASAIFAALASAFVSLAVSEALITARSISAARARFKPGRSKRGKKSGDTTAKLAQVDQPQDSWVIAFSAAGSGLLLALSHTLWGYATIAEVYTLTSFLIVAIFLMLFSWRRVLIGAAPAKKERTAKPEESPPSHDGSATSANRASLTRPLGVSPSDRLLYAAAFTFGLALGAHHVSVVLMLPAFAALVFATEDIRFFLSRRLLYAALFAFAGLFLVYAYLPFAASRSPIMNWGDPRTLERLWWQVSGKQYQVFFSFSLATMIGQFSEFLKLAASEFGPWWLPVGPAMAVAGLVRVFHRDRAMFWFLVLAIVADLGYALGYEIAEDKDAYYLPAFIAMTIASGYGLEWLINKIRSESLGWLRIPWIPVPATAAALVLLISISALAGNWGYNNRRHYYIAQDYVVNILASVAPGGMLLTRDWQVYSPMLYSREVEHERRDAVVIDVNQLRRSWYYDYLRRAFPATIEQANDKVEAFLEDLRRWEHDPDLYQRDLTLNQRINSRFFEMILAFVSNHIRSAPVYVTLDIAGNREGNDAELTRSLTASYQLVPQGLIFEVTTDRGFKQPVDYEPIMRGLADGTIKFTDDDVVKVKVLPVYVTMFYNRGRYLAAHGRHDQAIESFKRALALNPRFSVAQQAANESLNALRKGVETNPQ